MSEMWIEREDGIEMVGIKRGGDVIYRQDAIDAVEHTKSAKAPDGEVYVAKINAEMNIQLLPSAQPKAIRPKFVAEDRYIKNHFTTYPHCPKCNYELETGDCYCKVCGCHIDWSEDDVPGNGLKVVWQVRERNG